jgi:hypothetical protein
MIRDQQQQDSRVAIIRVAICHSRKRCTPEARAIQREDAFKQTSKNDEEYLEKVPKELLDGQPGDYVEYSKSGAVVN